MVEGRTAAYQRSTGIAPQCIAYAVDGLRAEDQKVSPQVLRTLTPVSVPRARCVASSEYQFQLRSSCVQFRSPSVITGRVEGRSVSGSVCPPNDVLNIPSAGDAQGAIKVRVSRKSPVALRNTSSENPQSPKAILSRTFQRLADQARQSSTKRMTAHWSRQETTKGILEFPEKSGPS